VPAVEVSRTTIYRRAHDDPAFACRLDLARVPVTGPPDDPLDWTVVARQLEAEDPMRWALPGGSGDPFNFDPEVS
jgi:hypothetical protein